MEFAIEGVLIGRLNFKLYDNEVPLTAENFRQLCTHQQGFGYQGNVLHRIVPGFCLQGGDITTGDGKGGRSIYKAPMADLWGNFKDEQFLDHSKKWLLSMANKGPNTNT